MFGNSAEYPETHEGITACEAADYDPRSPKERHEDHFRERLSKHPDSECFVILDDKAKSVAGVVPGGTYEIVHCTARGENFDDQGRTLTVSLECAEYGRQWISDFVPVERVYKTHAEAESALRALIYKAKEYRHELIVQMNAEIQALSTIAQSFGIKETP